MHLLSTSLGLLIVATSACAPVAKLSNAQEPAPTAMAKRAPLQPGERVSPVIAFRGAGEQWSVQIENAGGHAHTVELTWGSQHASGGLQYQGPAAAAAPILLVGALDTPTGPRAMRVEITSAACSDQAGQAYSHTVRVTVAGMAPMPGCGDLAK